MKDATAESYLFLQVPQCTQEVHIYLGNIVVGLQEGSGPFFLGDYFDEELCLNKNKELAHKI